MHPFLPNAIWLVVSFLNASTPDIGSLDEGNSERVDKLLCALRYLGDVNTMARERLCRIETDTAPSIISARTMSRSEWTE